MYSVINYSNTRDEIYAGMYRIVVFAVSLEILNVTKYVGSNAVNRAKQKHKIYTALP